MSEWHLDKKFSIIIIISMLTQAGSVVWYGSKADSRIATLELRPDLTERMIKVEFTQSEHGRLLGKIYESLKEIKLSVNKFNVKQAGFEPRIKNLEELIKNSGLKARQ